MGSDQDFYEFQNRAQVELDEVRELSQLAARMLREKADEISRRVENLEQTVRRQENDRLWSVGDEAESIANGLVWLWPNLPILRIVHAGLVYNQLRDRMKSHES